MATIVSAQSGNFSSTSTWTGGVVPGDGDRFDVSSGHTVTIDTGISVPTNGYADSYVYGILTNQASQNTTLRMDGRLYIKGGGCLHLTDGAKIQITGTSSEQHGVWVENENNVHVVMQGSDGMPCTTLSSTHNEGSTSLSVASGTNFAAGEWISIFNHITAVTSDTNDHTYQHEDEGFWIHEVSGNTIYFRIFGGPNDVTVTRASSTYLFVSNAKVFREGQTIIFGTGSNRNIKTISSINYNRNRLTLDSAVTGTVTGEIVYLTGTEKLHTNGSKVRKVATLTTASASSGATSITVANANMFAAGDEIWIEHRGEADGSTDYEGRYDYSSYARADWYKHTISSVSSNTITLSTGTNYTVVEGALVTRMSRNIVIETTATDGSDYGFFYKEHISDYNNTFIAKDVYLKNMGNDDSNAFCGFSVRGIASTDNSPVTLSTDADKKVPSRTQEPWIEGVVVHAYPENTHRRDWGPFWLYDMRYAKARCCMSMNGEDGLCAYYEPGCSIVNSISVAARERGCRIEGNHEWWEFSYNYISRTYWASRFLLHYEQGLGVHDNIFDAALYGMQAYNANPGLSIYRCRFTACRYGFLIESSGQGILYSYVKPLSGYVNVDAETGTQQAGTGWTGRNFRTVGAAPMYSVEHNYEIDAMRLYGYNWEAKWDNEEKAWRFFRRHDSDDNPMISERIFIPAGVTVRVSAKVKYSSNYVTSDTEPYLGAVDLISAVGENRLGNSGGADSSQWAGKRYYVQFTTAAQSAFEEKQLTITSKPYPRNYVIGVYSTNRDLKEGFWVKDLAINIDKPYKISPFNITNNQNTFSPIPTQVRQSFTKQKKRLGGRLI